MAFALDHVWIATADRDAVLDRLSRITGLPVLDAWAPAGVVQSRGVRFANGPFLDVHGAESGAGAVVLLRGGIAEAEELAAQHGWAVKAQRREDAPADRRPPWSLLFFRRGQGALSGIAIIEYEIDPQGYALAEYDQPLLFLDSAPSDGPRLARVTVGGGGDLAALGCPGLAAAEGQGVHLEIAGARGPPIRLGHVEATFTD
ncbi:hypothetical protein [Phenylobacterium sp. J367]|uniref:hypothetical protein n=1 Tax=Phenylobacterium sp. J367 TaxID=2898435 RepID=UPI002150DABD|nr:hypothetical protein [Phenylobacterium sp. J367]MCR5877447.1 hypothetical protein [Phenylobacterium sp. J367]